MPGSLTHSPADIVRYLMINNLSLGTLPTTGGSWPICVGAEPDTPDEVITVYKEADVHQGRSMIDGEVFERNGFSIRVRAQTENSGWGKMDDIVAAFDKSVNRTTVSISDTDYLVHAISRTSSALHIGTQSPDTELELFTLNCTIAVRQQ